MLLSALTSASAILSPFVIGQAVTALDAGNPAQIILLLLLALYVSDWLVRFLQQFFMASIGQRMIRYIRNSLFDCMKKLPLAFFDSKQHGELMSRLTNDVDNISATLQQSITQVITSVTTVVGVLIMMLTISPILTLISIIVIPLSGILMMMVD